MLYVCSAPAGSFFHKQFIEMLWSLTTRQQDIPEFHLDFFARLQEQNMAFPWLPSPIFWY